jgi:hypothetical protein
LTLLAFAAMTLFSRRSAAWFGMAQIPILAGLLQGWWRQPWPLQGSKPTLTALLAVALLLVSALALPWWRPRNSTLFESRPWLAPTTGAEAVAVLCDSVPAGTRGFQAIQFASYMEVACPDLPTFMDTRFELYPTEQWDEYLDIQNGRYNWPELAAKYGMEYILADTDMQSHLIDAAAANPEWQELYRDDQAALFRKARP